MKLTNPIVLFTLFSAVATFSSAQLAQCTDFEGISHITEATDCPEKVEYESCIKGIIDKGKTNGWNSCYHSFNNDGMVEFTTNAGFLDAANYKSYLKDGQGGCITPEDATSTGIDTGHEVIIGDDTCYILVTILNG